MCWNSVDMGDLVLVTPIILLNVQTYCAALITDKYIHYVVIGLLNYKIVKSHFKSLGTSFTVKLWPWCMVCVCVCAHMSESFYWVLTANYLFSVFKIHETIQGCEIWIQMFTKAELFLNWLWSYRNQKLLWCSSYLYVNQLQHHHLINEVKVIFVHQCSFFFFFLLSRQLHLWKVNLHK